MLGDAFMSIQEVGWDILKTKLVKQTSYKTQRFKPTNAIDAYETAMRRSPKDFELAVKIGDAYVKCHLYNKVSLNLVKYIKDFITNQSKFFLKNSNEKTADKFAIASLRVGLKKALEKHLFARQGGNVCVFHTESMWELRLGFWLRPSIFKWPFECTLTDFENVLFTKRAEVEHLVLISTK